MLHSTRELWRLLDEAGAGAAVHLVGAGGCGVSALGHVLLDMGFRVSGSDLSMNEAMVQLRDRGAMMHEGHSSSHVFEAQPVCLVYSSAVPSENVELNAAAELGMPVVRRGEFLAAMMSRQRGVCVSGMHGKTTTTAMLAFVLDRLGCAPSYAVGALLPQMNPHGRWSVGEKTGSPPLFVAETDESDGTLGAFRPDHAIVLNVDDDHLDHFGEFEAVCEAFGRFGSRVRERLVYCGDDERLASLYSGHPTAVSYGFSESADYRVSSAAWLESARCWEFSITAGARSWGPFRLGLIGRQNVSNAAAVVSLLLELDFDARMVSEALALFRGVMRRQQLVFANRHYRVFDDYGHHPTEIKATLRAFREAHSGRLLVAFQPHRYTRTHQLMNQFASSFRGADRLWLTDIYAASERAIPGVDGSRLAEAIRATGQPVDYRPTLEGVREAVRQEMKPGDLMLFLGAGDITQAAHELAADLERAAHVEALEDSAQLSWAKALRSMLSPKTLIRTDEPLARRTTLRVGGSADCYVEPANEGDLQRIMQYCRDEGVPVRILGRGSNLLVRDGGVRGVVIHLAQPAFCGLEVDGVRIKCGAGARLKSVALEARRHGIGGLEFLEGIPGSVGGALRMNAGAMGAWTFQRVESLRLMNRAGEVQELPGSALGAGYRGCEMLRNHIALGAVWCGHVSTPEAVDAIMRGYSQRRWATQPSAPSAGCVFKNPDRAPAGMIIDRLGLKGLRVGGAVVSPVHGNFIVNEGGASAREVLELIAMVQDRVRRAEAVELETEVEIIGED